MSRRLTATLAAVIVVMLTANLALAAKELRAVVRPTWNDDKVLTILVIGSDAGLPRPGDPRTGRSDAIHIIAVDTRKLTATIVDIPRDSLIGGAKVNGFMDPGGPQRLKAVLSDHTGINFDYYALTNFRGLRGLVRGMGGVKINLGTGINDAPAQANLKAGEQTLTGDDALSYTRARKTLSDGDFGRTRHQGHLMRAAHAQIRARQSGLDDLTGLLGTFSRNVDTDIPPTQLFRLASLAVKIRPREVKQVSLSGGIGFVGAESVVFLNAGSAFSDIRKGRIGP